MIRAGTQPRSAGIDGLRGIAALAVLVYHAWLYSLPVVRAGRQDSTADYVLHELRLGLVLFFVLSGYLLFRPWVRAALDNRPAPSVRRYARHRAARILPAYWVALAGSVALLWGAAGTPGVRLPDASGLWLFVVLAQNFTEGTLLKLDPPMWTLAVEATFYVVLPVVGWLALRPRLRTLGRAGQLVLPLVLLVVGVWWNQRIAGRPDLSLTLTKILPAMLPYFAVGMGAAVLFHGRAPRRVAVVLLGLLALGLIGADAYWHGSNAAIGSHDLALRIWRDLPAATGFAILVALVGSARGAIPVLGSRPLAAAGTVSYGLYLWHVPVLLVARANGLLPSTTLGALAVALPASLLVAAASWFAVERPAIRWAQRRDADAAAPPIESVAPESPAPAPVPAAGVAGARPTPRPVPRPRARPSAPPARRAPV